MGVEKMETKYYGSIPDENVNAFIDKLINQTFSLLPLYEEKGDDEILTKQFEEKQANIIARLNGFLQYMIVDSNIRLEILVHAENLNQSKDHSDYRKHILKICNLLSHLKAKAGE